MTKFLIVSVQGVSSYADLMLTVIFYRSIYETKMEYISQKVRTSPHDLGSSFGYNCAFESKINVVDRRFSSVCMDPIVGIMFILDFNGYRLAMVCPPNCVDCTSKGECTYCKTNFYFVEGSCLPCDRTCFGCYGFASNCVMCDDSSTPEYVTMNQKDLNFCPNCKIPDCKVCLYGVCLLCESGFAFKNQHCVDCTKAEFFEQCFPLSRTRFVSTQLGHFITYLDRDPDRGIHHFTQTPCEESEVIANEDKAKCGQCYDKTANKFDYMQCFWRPEHFDRRLQSQTRNREVNRQLSPVAVTNYRPEPANQDPQITTSGHLPNCALESEDASECLACRPGFYPAPSGCRACPENCLVCDSAQSCRLCLEEFTLVTIDEDQRVCRFAPKADSVDLTKCQELALKLPGTRLAESSLARLVP